nr:glycosyltransferase family 4 protein [Marivita lacus]
MANLSDRCILSQSAHVLSVSDWNNAKWREFGLSARIPCQTVLNGIRIPAHCWRPRKQGTVLGVASRLAERRGLEELVDAMGVLKAAGRGDIQLRIAGDGPERSALERRAAGLPITFVGHVSDMDKFWAETDLSVFTALWEPFGLRLIEPAARGIPVVAYRNGSGSDEVIDLCRGVSAVPYGDSAALVREIIDILETPSRYGRMAREGRQDCETHFSLDAMAESVDAVYARMPA